MSLLRQSLFVISFSMDNVCVFKTMESAIWYDTRYVGKFIVKNKKKKKKWQQSLISREDIFLFVLLY